jgi:phage-related minor tail protein
VVNANVRIEWSDANGKRRSRTIEPNSVETRQQADAALEEIPMQLQRITADAELEAKGGMAPVEQALRKYATYILDAADQLYDWISSAVQDLSRPSEAAEDQVVDEAVEDETAAQETPDQEAE